MFPKSGRKEEFGGRKWQGVRETGCCPACQAAGRSVSAEGGDDPAVAGSPSIVPS
ncbi:MAG: hypothetical protein HY360_19985 [Verrucomicrobia bacterium]|nr:hypothetical protein [Verrucomicrobiota bacterium]